MLKKVSRINIKLYQHSSSLPEGKDDELFDKKPDIGIELIDRSLSRGHRPGIVLIDGGYGMGYNISEKTRRKGIKILRKNC